MKFLDHTFPTPAENLACDEALLDECDEHGGESLRFWESPMPFVVVGYGNRIASEVNAEECRRRGVPILRRCSGGGTVVQGPGCWNYNLVLRIPESGPLTTVTGTNEFVMERNRAALAKLLGVSVTVQGHTDLAFREAQGRVGASNAPWLKFSGNAQRRRRRALVFHGTILHGFDLRLIDALLSFPSAQPDYRADRSHGEFVRNIPATSASLCAAYCEAWSACEPLAQMPTQRLESLRREQYENTAWNGRR